MNDQEFFKLHPNASYAEFCMFTWHEKFHKEKINPNCTFCEKK